MRHSPGFLKLVDDAKSRVKEADFRDIKRRLDSREKLTLVDVREDNEWARGHLPGAVHLGKGIIERDVEETFPDKDALLVLYCGGGFRSALVADNLQKMGYTNVVSMDGGWRGWTTAGYPIDLFPDICMCFSAEAISTLSSACCSSCCGRCSRSATSFCQKAASVASFDRHL